MSVSPILLVYVCLCSLLIACCQQSVFFSALGWCISNTHHQEKVCFNWNVTWLGFWLENGQIHQGNQSLRKGIISFFWGVEAAKMGQRVPTGRMMSRSHTSLLRDAASGTVCKLPPEACYQFKLAKMFVKFCFCYELCSLFSHPSSWNI